MRPLTLSLIAVATLVATNMAISQESQPFKITSFKVVEMEVEDDLLKPTLVTLTNDISAENREYTLVEGRGQITKIGKHSVVEYQDTSSLKIRAVVWGDKQQRDTSYLTCRADDNKLNISSTFYLYKQEWTTATRTLCRPIMNRPAMLFTENKPQCPNVLIIGTSISIGYTPFLREILSQEANVYRIPENSNSTAVSLPKIDFWLGDMKWDVIHVNWGLHDLKYTLGDKVQDVPPAQYRANLRKLFTRMQATGAKIIWANTSYYPEKCTPRRDVGDDALYNQIALEVLKDFPDIMVDDHYTLTKNNPDKQIPNNVHFLDEGYAQQAEQAATAIRAALSSD